MLGPLGCGIQTGAGAVFNIFNLSPGKTLAIYGVGSLGLSAIMAAKIAGAGKIIAVDLNLS
jgi:aryl-alcohol dehydrogenase